MSLNTHNLLSAKKLYSRLLIGLFLTTAHLSFGQEQISGIINNYSKVSGLGSCPGSILVQDASGFTVGQRVLLLGMQGGSMWSDNDGNFGTVQAAGLTAGLYDWSFIENIVGTEITLAHAISPGYDFTAAVQLIGVPVYEDAVVVGDLLPQAWDGQTGGVVALEVRGTLTLEGNVDASGLGFRGGLATAVNSNCNFLSNISDYSYDAGNWRGAAKGEGIIPFLPDKENGRGPQANGGGGGNDHNAGGGGGSNTSSGGRGGENREPSTFGCDGNFPGLGGRDLDAFTLRWFMGGGGGAGHSNNTEGKPDGGNGGGIVVIKADELVFAGGAVLADGTNGVISGGDGGGGGGGGGTVILDVANISGDPLISAKGGRGGDANNIPRDRCLGPGGGGGGGQVYSTVAITPSIAGGDSGLSINSDDCPEGPNGATAGTSGAFLAIGIKAPSEKSTLEIELNSTDTLICPGSSFSLSAGVAGSDSLSLNYRWSADTGSGWQALSDGSQYSGTASLDLTVNDLSQAAAFQLSVSGTCGELVLSDTIRVAIDPAGAMPTAAFTYTGDELDITIENTSTGAGSYEWSVPEWPEFSSSEPEPEITFPAAGSYELVLKAYGSCGVDSTSQIIAIGGAPVALFSGEFLSGNCIPVMIQWTSESTGQFDTYEWTFPGGSPATSSEPDPLITYYDAGVYDVRLKISGPLGESILTQPEIVKVFSVPQPAFNYQISGHTVSFFNPVDTFTQYSWTFGDGNRAGGPNPVHTYAEAGAYDVTLNVQNGACGQSITQTILVFPSSLQDHTLPVEITWYPNPTMGYLQMQGDAPDLYPLDLLLFTSNGQLVRKIHLTQPAGIDIGAYSSGAYWLLIDSPLGHGSWKIMKQ